MSKERIEIGTVVEVADAKQSINELRQSIEDSKTSLKSLNSGTEDYNNEIKGLVSAQKDLIGLQESLINKFEDTSSVTSNLNSNLSVATNTVNGMMGGFQALQGVMVLAGKENKNLVNTLVKLQAVSSVVQGFKQFTDAVKAGNMAFKIFNTTVRANPLIFLATSIITVIGLIKTFTSDVDDASDSLENLNEKTANLIDEADRKIKERRKSMSDAFDESFENFIKSDEYYRKYGERISDITNKSKKEIAILKARGATTLEINKKELEAAKEINDIKGEYMRDETDRHQALNIQYEESVKAFEEYKKYKDEMEKLDKDTDASIRIRINKKFKTLKEKMDELYKKEREAYNSSNKAREEYFREREKIGEKNLEYDVNKRFVKPIEDSIKLEKKLDAVKEKYAVASRDRVEAMQAINLSYMREITKNNKDRLDIVSKRSKEIEGAMEEFSNIEEETKERLENSNLSIQQRISMYEELYELNDNLMTLEQEKISLSSELYGLDEDRAETLKEIAQIEREMTFYKGMGELEVENAGTYVSNIDKEIELYEKQLEAKKEIRDINYEIYTNENTSWEERLEALNIYNGAMMDSYHLEASIVEAKIELKEREMEAINATLQVTADSLMAMSDLAKEGTVVQKTLAIAGTTISTLASAQNIYESTAKIPFVGKVLAPIASATALMQGYKRVKEIAKVKVPNGKKGGSGVMPQPQILQSMPNVQQTVTKMDGDDLDIINKDSKVYVVESDITNQQRRVKVAENEASF